MESIRHDTVTQHAESCAMGDVNPQGQPWLGGARYVRSGEDVEMLPRASLVGGSSMAYSEPRTGDLDRLGGSLAAGSQDPVVWAIPLRWDDGRATELLRPNRRGSVARLHWLRQGWLPVASLNYALTYLDEHGNEVATESRVAVDLVTGHQIGVPPSERPLKLVPRSSCTLLPRWSPEEIGSQVEAAWQDLLAAEDLEAVARCKEALAARGVPPFAETLAVVVESPFLLPFYAGLVDTASGEEVQVVEGITVNHDSYLSFLLTAQLDELTDELLAGRRVRGVEET